MSGTRGSYAKFKEQIGKTTRRRLTILIGCLSVIIALLKLGVGQELWPMWLVGSQPLITGTLLFVIVFLILLSPLIIEYEKNPRHLSGPGKNPKGPNLPDL